MPFLQNLEKEDSNYKIRFFKSEFEGQVKAQVSDRARAERNFKAFDGTNGGFWPDTDIAALQEAGRPISTFNIAQANIDVLHGCILEHLNEVKFEPNVMVNFDSTQANVMQALWNYDYERGNYEYHKSEFIRNALIHTGVFEMFLDTSTDPLGNIGIKSINPFHVYQHSFWQTEDEKDLDMVFTKTWMTANQIKDTYDTKSEIIDELVRYYDSVGLSSAAVEELDKVADRSGEYYDELTSRFGVVQVIYMQKKKVDTIYSKKDKCFLDIVDKNTIKALATLDPENYLVIPETKNICKIFTFAPAISYDLVLEEGDHPVQVGRLPYVFCSYKNIFGHRQGIMDLIYDANVSLNKRESIITAIQQTTANSGYFYEEDAFANDAEATKFTREINAPGYVGKLNSGALSQRKIDVVPRSNVPTDFMNSSMRMQQLIDAMTHSVSALNARSEGANESSILFASKVEQGMSPFKGFMKSLERVDNVLAEMYETFARVVYSDIPRIFKTKSGEVVSINQWTPEGVANSITMLPRHNIIISKSKNSTKYKKERMLQFMETSKAISNPILRSRYELENIQNLELENLEDIKKQAEQFVTFQYNQMVVQNAQIEQQLKQIQNPPQPQGMPGMPPQDGMPPEGPREASTMPGMGNLPNNIAGGDNIGSNKASPSDFR